MLTEQDLHDMLAETADDPMAEQLTIGLSDRALAEARGGAWLRRSLTGKRRPWVPVVAVGSAFAVATVVGVAAFGSGSGKESAAAVLSFPAPDTTGNPVGQSALTEFGAECFDGHGPKLALSYIWDPATQQYRGVADRSVYQTFLPSPDGKRALVERNIPGSSQGWAVATWSDAVAGRLVFHPIADGFGVRWTTDGKEVVTVPAWGGGPDKSDSIVLRNKNADFFDPASGRSLASVPLPQRALTMVASGQWAVQQWQGDHATAQFPLLSSDGNQMEVLNAEGVTVRTLTLKEGLPANSPPNSVDSESAEISPDGRFLAESSGGKVATFDLGAGGRRVGTMEDPQLHFKGWTGDHQIVTAAQENESSPAGQTFPPSKTGYSAVYSVLSPELKVLQQSKFVLPADPQGECATWPMSWAPKGQFPGAFVP